MPVVSEAEPSAERQKIQLELAFTQEDRGEAPRPSVGGTEAHVAGRGTESRAQQERTMEVVCQRENLTRALRQVRRNRGRPGVDGMTVDELPGYLATHWPQIQTQLLVGTYKPQPVRRVEIPKPGGGMRTLGIPTVLDRFIQQAVLQVLQARWDPTFSEDSYGFRPRKSAHQAVAKAQGYIAEGYGWVVDMDLEKFFDRVNHDRLMAQVAKRESDKRLLKLLRAFLEAGAMEGGLVSPTREGTPQGGPLSPLLSNLVLDELDRELTRRGHRFVRYADDCNIYVRSERAGQRVMASISTFIIRKLKLRVNEHKSAVARPRERKFLGFRILGLRKPKRGIAPEALRRFRQQIRELTRRRRGISLERRIGELRRYLQGWIAYFGFCETPSVLTHLDGWIRRRLRSVVWHQWKTPRRRWEQLRRAAVRSELAHAGASSARGPWRVSKSHALHTALPNATFTQLGLPSLAALARP